MARLYLACCLLLFFATAWVRADRTLVSLVKYKLPLAVRARFTAVRLYWVVDALLSGLVALAYSPLAGLPGKLFETTLLGGLNVDSSVSHLSYPLVAALLGFYWPQLSAFTISVGRGNETALRLSLGQLRDYLLGGSALGPIDARSHLAIVSYVDRVVEAAMQPPEESGPEILQALGLPPSLAADRAQLRATVLARAEQDCPGVYAAVSAVKMIPLLERSRPLMMVPDITAHEEEKLYLAGITTVGGLARGEPGTDAGLSPQRLSALRLAARRLMAKRLWFGFGLAAVAIVVIGLGSLSLALYPVERLPSDGPQFRLSDPAAISSNADQRP